MSQLDRKKSGAVVPCHIARYLLRKRVRSKYDRRCSERPGSTRYTNQPHRVVVQLPGASNSKIADMPPGALVQNYEGAAADVASAALGHLPWRADQAKWIVADNFNLLLGSAGQFQKTPGKHNRPRPEHIPQC